MKSRAMKTVRAYLNQHADAIPERTFLIAPDSAQNLSFAALKSGVDAIGVRLDQLGVKRGRKIGFLLNNGYWATQLLLGVMANNRIIVPLNALAGKAQLQHILAHSDTEIVFVSPEYEAKLATLMATLKRDIVVIGCTEKHGPKWHQNGTMVAPKTVAPKPQDPALLLYTSGSTGLPKGAILSHLAVVSGGQNIVGGHGLTAADRALCVLPIYHINGAMVTVIAPLVSGSCVVMPEKFKVSAFWQLIADYQCSWCSIVPTIIKYLLDRAEQQTFDFGNQQRFGNFRFGRSASAPLAAVVLKQWEQVFKAPMIETIGLTETAGTVATNPLPPLARKPGSVGLPYGNQIEIFDRDNQICIANVVGEIVIRGNNVFDGYYKNPEATKAAFTDGWFHTGDLGLKDDDGYIFVTGRLKELIIRGGENIAPREIDDVLYQHQAILEAAAFGVDDDDYGQEVCACVALRHGYNCDEQELKAFCEAAIGKYKSPKSIYFMDALPKGPSGKILRLQLAKITKAL